MAIELISRAMSIAADEFDPPGAEKTGQHSFSMQRKRRDVLVALASIADDETGLCWCSRLWLGRATHLNKGDVGTMLSWLEDARFLLRKRLVLSANGFSYNAQKNAFMLYGLLPDGPRLEIEQAIRPYLRRYVNDECGPHGIGGEFVPDKTWPTLIELPPSSGKGVVWAEGGSTIETDRNRIRTAADNRLGRP